MSSAVETTILQNANWQSCIDACMRCAEACEFCATLDLKEEEDIKMIASCAQMNRQCAAVCWTSAVLMSMDSQFAKQFCNLCADICDACAQECEKHDVDHCKKCAQACRSCAEECRKMAQQ
ncbi:MAG: four-helix bundle copper-binding protein [Thermoproteota archaeon]|nr:four-helix bundle copper-binding protein [Thermoproteota archaeon]